MSTTDIRETLGRWRKAATSDNEKENAINRYARLLIVCIGTLFLLLLIFAGVRSIHGSSDAVVDSKLLQDASNSTLGVRLGILDKHIWYLWRKLTID